ncbi:WD40 repeat-like protein [Rickenella mellea]|uniref:WD40 repeat-like protein n=1 Tax=Rickenella mellea TaxID=50990 RepID=A0A4Y7PJI9_9AGAM|nr:WD40 repeat-like protein [Rickenella mellea]
MSETAETTIAKGTYTIENVHRLNDIFLVNGTLVAGTSEADAHPPLDACWMVIPLKNRRYYISPAAQRNHEIVSTAKPHQWVVREARVKETFVISPGRHHLYWGIEDDDDGTAVTLRYPPTGPGNQWRFRPCLTSTPVIPQDIIRPRIADENPDYEMATQITTVTVDDGRPPSSTQVTPQSVVGSPAIDGSNADSQTATTPIPNLRNEVDDGPARSTCTVPQNLIESPNVDDCSQPREVVNGRPPSSTLVAPQSVVESLTIDGNNADSKTLTTPILSQTGEVVAARSTCVAPQDVIESPNFDEKVDCPTVTDPTRIQPREAVSGRPPSSTPVSPQSMIGSLAIDGSNVESQISNAPNRSQISEAVDSLPSRPTSVVPQRVIESPNIDESLNFEAPAIPTRDLLREEVDSRQATPTTVVPQSVVESRTIADSPSVSSPNQTRNANDDRPAIRHILEGHTYWVYSVAFSPDGDRIVSASRDLTIRVWDGTDWVLSVAFSPDGTRFVSGSSDKTVRIWDAQSGTLSWTLNGHTDWVRSVACSPDGKRIVSGSDDNTVRVWDVETGCLILGPLLRHTEYVHSVHFSPDGKQLLSGSLDGTVRVWDAETGHAIRTFSGQSPIWSAMFSPDSKQIVSGDYGGNVMVWDMQSSDSIMLKGHNSVHSVAFSPDGGRIVSGGYDRQIIVWDAKLGKAIGRLEGHSDYVQSVAFSPDGKWIVSGSDDRTVRIWEADRLDAMPDVDHA